MAGNRDLNQAARAKKDEFYTQLTDIEKSSGIIRIFSKAKPFSVTAMTRMKATFSNTLP